jgi:hypothetical protein
MGDQMKHAYTVPWAEGTNDAETAFYVVVAPDGERGPKVTIRIDVKLHAEGKGSTFNGPAVRGVQDAVQKWVESHR